MSKISIKIELDGKPIGTKSLLINDSLPYIRERIKEKNKCYIYIFRSIWKSIDNQDENNYTLENILNGKSIKIQTIKGSSDSNINIIINDKIICIINVRMTVNWIKLEI